ncbi:sigma factor-like helix-turn-helix DNA-binding protein [Paenarthrobacter nitroguajacolicus]|uniref:sigma factor-like helix-turn-helix DNA-binding protein n=1 Tax=Paenarthrobacter nitroguajacolicus TaxID=211146 RepID=UPI003441D13A
MTTTPELSREERDAAMVERYADGETLDAIGQSFGVTRERVRQIIAKVGGTSAEESRKSRLVSREAAASAARNAFMAEYGDLARQMAKRGVTRPEAIDKLKALFPMMDAELAEDALRTSSIVFDKSQMDDIFSKEVLAAGVWYLLGSDLGLAPDREWAAINIELSLITELRAVLESAEATAEDVSTILGVIGAAQKHIAENPGASITTSRYHQLRGELITALGLVSRQGAFLWPPTGQTLMKRFGGWNECLVAMGIGTATKGRPKGLVKFNREDYDQAVSDYCLFASETGAKSTIIGYDAWVKTEIIGGQKRPSGASLRNFYGSWSDALRAVQG